MTCRWTDTAARSRHACRADRLGGQEPAIHQPPHVVEHRAGVATEPPGELLVGHRPVSVGAQDAKPERMAKRLHLARRRVAQWLFL